MDQEEASGSMAQTSTDSSVEGTNLVEKLQLEAERRKRKLEYCREWKKKQKVQKIEQGLVKTPLTESERLQRKRENQKRYRERKKEAKMKSNEQKGLVRTPLTESERLQRKRKNDKRYRERKKEAKMMSNEQEECEEKQFQNPHQTRSVQKSQSNKSKKEQEEEILQPTVEVFVPENCVSNFATEEAYNENNPLDHSSSGEEDNIEEQSITDEDNELSSLPVQVFIKEESHDEDDDETLPGQKHVQTGQYLRSILLNGSKK